MEFLTRITEANGFALALIGITTVFIALAAVWLTTEAYARIFQGLAKRKESQAKSISDGNESSKDKTKTAGYDADQEAAVAVIAVALRKKSKKTFSVADPAGAAGGIAGSGAAWAMEGRLRALSNKPR